MKPRGAMSPTWKGDDIGYTGAHRRVYAARGRAGEHTCACGAQAAQWAYGRGDPQEREGRTAAGRPVPFSVDPAFYLPMCAKCHRAFDLAHTPRKTHCCHGHAYTPATTYISRTTGRRSCLTCREIKNRGGSVKSSLS